MNCPICLGVMKKKTHAAKKNENGTIYDKTLYNCEKDDTWIFIETPTDKEQKFQEF